MLSLVFAVLHAPKLFHNIPALRRCINHARRCIALPMQSMHLYSMPPHDHTTLRFLRFVLRIGLLFVRHNAFVFLLLRHYSHQVYAASYLRFQHDTMPMLGSALGSIQSCSFAISFKTSQYNATPPLMISVHFNASPSPHVSLLVFAVARRISSTLRRRNTSHFPTFPTPISAPLCRYRSALFDATPSRIITAPLISMPGLIYSTQLLRRSLRRHSRAVLRDPILRRICSLVQHYSLLSSLLCQDMLSLSIASAHCSSMLIFSHAFRCFSASFIAMQYFTLA